MMRMSRCRMTIFYSGRVQGVGFRMTVRGVVMGYEVTGVVANLPDGRVQVTASGPEADLAALRSWLREGPSQAVVTALDCEPCAEESFEGFAVR